MSRRSPSLPTYRETIMIKEFLSKQGEIGAREDVIVAEEGCPREWSRRPGAQRAVGERSAGVADMVRQERVADLPVPAKQLKAVEGKSPTMPGDSDASAGLVIEPLAASFSYYASNGASYAQRFAPSTAPRWFYYVIGGDCTNFVSQCVWAGYGGYVSGNDTASKNNIANKVRMVPNVWHGRTGGGMPNWESVSSFWTYAVSSKTKGPVATGYNNGGRYTGINSADVRAGNVLQVRNGSSGSYGHSVYVSQKGTVFSPQSGWDVIYVCQHTSDWKNRSASNLIASWGGSDCYMRRLAFTTATFDQ